MNISRFTQVGAVVAAILLTATGCAPSETGAARGDSAVEQTQPAAESVRVIDGWVKAAAEGMSAGFGVIENNSGADVVLLSAESNAAHMVELHETVQDDAGAMVMQQKQGGFTIPAGGRFALEPGANHLMLMGLLSPLLAGNEVTFTLTFEDGSKFTYTAPIKDYSGANENYSGDHGSDHGSDHGDETHE